MSTTDRAERAAWLRYALVKMTIRYGTTTQNMCYAYADGEFEKAERHQRAERRQFAAIKRLADALEALARGAR